MKLPPEQLTTHFRKQMAPLYLVSGDDTLLVQEAADLVRAQARKSGCEERIVFHAEKGFDWNELAQASQGMSLFAQRRLIEIRLSGARPGDAGSKALMAYVEELCEENVLLVVAAKLDKAIEKTKWYKSVDKVGVTVPVWPPDRRQFPAWVEQRMRARGLRPNRQAVAILAERAEGNLLACAQEIDKLYLLHGDVDIDEQTVLGSVADSARFDVFTLVDSALEGDAPRVTRILNGLRAEGVEPTLVVWALAREIRSMASMTKELAAGTGMDQVLAKYRVWARRKPLIRGALQRHRLTRWWAMLCHAARIDRTIKGGMSGNTWDELLQLALLMATAKKFTSV